MLKPLVDQFTLDFSEAKVRDLRHWLKSYKSAQREDLPCVPTLSVLGSPEVKGTYFHPSIVS